MKTRAEMRRDIYRVADSMGYGNMVGQQTADEIINVIRSACGLDPLPDDAPAQKENAVVCSKCDGTEFSGEAGPGWPCAACKGAGVVDKP